VSTEGLLADVTEPTWQDLPLREELRGHEPYGAPQLDVPVRLNTNENPYPPSASLLADITTAVAEAAASMNRYPDRDALALRADLAAYLGHGLTARQVWAANGSNEIIQQLLQCFGGAGRAAIGFEPSYSMHRLISLATGTDWIAGSRASDHTLDPDTAVAALRRERPSVVFLTSPNNPTGTALPLDTIRRVVEAAAEYGAIVVVDEAYAEFARPGTPSALTLLDDPATNPGGRLVVTRTMSKAFAFAGARLGYLAAHPAVVDALQLVRLPYHLSAVTQAVARAALAHVDELLGTVEAIKQQRDRVVDELRAMGLRVYDSDANFVLFEVDEPRRVWRALVDRGVLIRDNGVPGTLRVTAGTPEETTTFLTALREVIA
jgi:histidinol-phosphate aminotransferase